MKLKVFVALVVVGLSVSSSVAGFEYPEVSTSLSTENDQPQDKKTVRTPNHRRLLPLSVPNLIHLWTGDADNANNSVGSSPGTLGTNTKFTNGKNGRCFDFDGSNAARVRLPGVNINTNVFPKFTSKCTKYVNKQCDFACLLLFLTKPFE